MKVLSSGCRGNRKQPDNLLANDPLLISASCCLWTAQWTASVEIHKTTNNPLPEALKATHKKQNKTKKERKQQTEETQNKKKTWKKRSKSNKVIEICYFCVFFPLFCVFFTLFPYDVIKTTKHSKSFHIFLFCFAFCVWFLMLLGVGC